MLYLHVADYKHANHPNYDVLEFAVMIPRHIILKDNKHSDC